MVPLIRLVWFYLSSKYRGQIEDWYRLSFISPITSPTGLGWNKLHTQGGNMKHTARIGLAGLLLVGLVVSISGCLNVDQVNVPPTNYESGVLFVDLANTGTPMAVSYDNTSVGTVNFGQYSSLDSLPSGSRRMKFVYGSAVDTLRQGFASMTQYTYFSVFDPANGDVARHYILAGQSYTFDSPGIKDTALVRFFNLSTDTVSDFSGGMDFTLGSASLGLGATGVAFGNGTGYMKIAAGNSSYEVFATNADTTGATPLIPTTTMSGLQSYGRYAVVVYGNHADIKSLVIQEH